MKTDYLESQGYPTDLTDEQWVTIAPLFVGIREYKHSKRELTNAGFDGGKNKRQKAANSN